MSTLHPGQTPLIGSVTAQQYGALTELWEASVRATHNFLDPAYIDELRPRVEADYLPAVTLAAAYGPAGRLLGFCGVAQDKLEMLFIAPDVRGGGVGKALLTHAIAHMGVREVDVNEQNEQAVGFYLAQGFSVQGRSELDGLGKPYPLLHLVLAEA